MMMLKQFWFGFFGGVSDLEEVKLMAPDVVQGSDALPRVILHEPAGSTAEVLACLPISCVF